MAANVETPRETAERIEGSSEEITISFVDMAWRLFDGRWMVLGMTLLGFVAGVALVLTMKPYFASTAIFMPPKNTDLSTMSASAASVLGGDETTDIYLGLLASRTVADDVIQHLDLMNVFKLKDMDQTRAKLSGDVTFTLNKAALVSITAKSKDPQLAAALANEYMEALYRLNGSMVASSSQHRRDFYEVQLQEQKVALGKAQADLKSTQEATGLVLPTGTAQAAVSATATLQAELGAAEARLSTALLSGTEQNPEVIQARGLVNQLSGQLARQSEDGSRTQGLATNRQLPGLELAYEQKAAEVKLRQGVYDALVQQYERARLSSIDPGPQLQVVERGIPAEHKAGPTRRNYALVGALLGFLLSMGYLLFTAPVRHFSRLLLRSRKGARA